MLEIPTKVIELRAISIGNYDFSIAKVDGHDYIEFEDILFATLIDDILATQILSLMEPPKGYYSLINLRYLYEDVTDEGSSITRLIRTPFVEAHGAIVLIELAIQERPEDRKLVAIKEFLKEELKFTAVDDEVVKYISENPWLEKIKKR